MGLRLRRLLGLEWEIWHVWPNHPPSRRPVERGLSRQEAERLAREWTDEAYMDDLSWCWEARRAPRWRR